MLFAFIVSVLILFGVGSIVLVSCRKSTQVKLILLTLVAMMAVLCIRMPLFIYSDDIAPSQPSAAETEAVDDEEVRVLDVPAAFLQSFVHAMQSVTLSEDMDSPVEKGAALLEATTSPLVADIYRIYSILLSLITPMLGGALLLEALVAVFPYLRLKFPSNKPVFIFSRINAQSIVLARSVAEETSARIIFQQTETADAEASRALIKRAKDMGGICLPGEVPLRSLNRRVRGVTYVYMDPEEKENIKDLARMLSTHDVSERTRAHVRCFAFAQSREAERTIDFLAQQYIPEDNAENLIVCMLNVQENLAEDILEKYPLHEYAADLPEGGRELNVLVVGSDALAAHFMANAYACGQMHDTRLRVTVTSPDAEAFAQKIYSNAPMLAENELNAVQMCGELQFVPMDTDVDDTLLESAQYVFISLGSDEVNAEMSDKIRRAIDRQKLTDSRRAAQRCVVLFNIEDDALYRLYQEKLTPVRLPSAKACEILPVGSVEQCYSAQVLFCEKHMLHAFFVDRAYSGEREEEWESNLMKCYADFMNKAYDRRSSFSAALHIPYRKHFMEHTNLNREQAENALVQVEHQRWTAYSMLNGYCCPTLQELENYAYRRGFDNKMKELMLHPCLVESHLSNGRELWDGSKPADELDELSLKMHDIAVKRLAVLLGEKTLLPAKKPVKRSDAEKIRNELEKLADALSDPEDKKYAAQLIDCILKDWREIDRDIVEKNQWIMDRTERYASQLQSFWKGR